MFGINQVLHSLLLFESVGYVAVQVDFQRFNRLLLDKRVGHLGYPLVLNRVFQCFFVFFLVASRRYHSLNLDVVPSISLVPFLLVGLRDVLFRFKQEVVQIQH